MSDGDGPEARALLAALVAQGDVDEAAREADAVTAAEAEKELAAAGYDVATSRARAEEEAARFRAAADLRPARRPVTARHATWALLAAALVAAVFLLLSRRAVDPDMGERPTAWPAGALDAGPDGARP